MAMPHSYDRLSAHEELCAERYKNIDLRLSRVEIAMWSAIVSLLGMMGYVIWQLVIVSGKLG